MAFCEQAGFPQIFVRDRDASTTVLASRASGTDGQQASTAAIEPDISADGRYVVFRSGAPNLSDDDAQNTDDIFERDLVENTTTLVSRADGATGAAASGDSRSARRCPTTARACSSARAPRTSRRRTTTTATTRFVRDTVTGTTTWVHGAPNQTPAAAERHGRRSPSAATAATSSSPAPRPCCGVQETGSFGDVFRRDLGGPPPPPPLPSASIGADQAVDEGGSGAVTPVGFTVTLSAPDARAIQLDWRTVANTATAGSDFRAASGQVTFAPGQTQAFISVDVLGDTADEPRRDVLRRALEPGQRHARPRPPRP